MISKAEEILKKTLISYLEKSKDSEQDRVDAVLDAMEEYGKLMYNQAINDAANNVEMEDISMPWHSHKDFKIDRESILKLKK